ncbi:MAG: C39 family peptidase [Candidatus Buchananbacteria bacterium]
MKRKIFIAYIFSFGLVGLAASVLTGCDKQTETALTAVPAATSAAIVESSRNTAAQPAPSTAVKPTEDKTTTSQSLPKSYQLDVDFAQQAPFANWDALHEEACEEATMIMVDKFYKTQPLNESIMEEEIQKLVKWESNKGYQVDLTAEETATVLELYFGLQAEVTSEVTTERIKREIFKGHLVIIPAAGRLLGNPNFKSPGPIYHMLVIKGWTGNDFVTNDPGTRKGDNYRYSYSTLLNAVRDWNPILAEDGMTDAEMAQGRKLMVIVSR